LGLNTRTAEQSERLLQRTNVAWDLPVETSFLVASLL
jgi:hypothetical protein